MHVDTHTRTHTHVPTTSLAEDPETSIHVLEKKAHEPSMNTMYNMACTGSVMMWLMLSGGER